jgi:hypothetical protein
MKKLAGFLVSSVSVFVFYFILKHTVLYWISDAPIETKLQPVDLLIRLIFLGLAVGLICWIVSLISERAAKYYVFPIIFFLFAFPFYLLSHFDIESWLQYVLNIANIGLSELIFLFSYNQFGNFIIKHTSLHSNTSEVGEVKKETN